MAQVGQIPARGERREPETVLGRAPPLNSGQEVRGGVKGVERRRARGPRGRRRVGRDGMVWGGPRADGGTANVDVSSPGKPVKTATCCVTPQHRRRGHSISTTRIYTGSLSLPVRRVHAREQALNPTRRSFARTRSPRDPTRSFLYFNLNTTEIHTPRIDAPFRLASLSPSQLIFGARRADILIVRFVGSPKRLSEPFER